MLAVLKKSFSVCSLSSTRDDCICDCL